jgi:DNA-binding XRE family transcriptional regulator
MMNRNNNSFGRRLSGLFTITGYSREELAKRLDVMLPVVRRWENGAASPDVYQFQQIADFFSLPYTWFLDDRGDLPDIWAIADRLGLSEGTVEQLVELAKTADGDMLDALDEAVCAVLSAVSAAREGGE